jgi:hypothetical protein
MISRKTGARLKKLKTLKNIKRRGKRGGKFEAQTYKLLKFSQPVSSKTKRKAIALSGQTDLLFDRLGIPAHPNPQSSPQFATKSYVQKKQRHSDVLDKLLEDIKKFRKRNDFVNAALPLRQAIELGYLPARAELADFFRTRRQMMKNPNERDEYYMGENAHNKAHSLVYGRDDPDCKGVLALLYLDHLDHHDDFSSWRLPNDPLFSALMDEDQHNARDQMGEAANRLAQQSQADGSKYGVYALGRWNWWNASEISNRLARAEMKVSPSGETDDEMIAQLRSEFRRAKRDGVMLIGIAANPPYSYDVAQYVYATCIRRREEGISLIFETGAEHCSPEAGKRCVMEADRYAKSESDKYFEMAAAQGFRPSRKLVSRNLTP